MARIKNKMFGKPKGSKGSKSAPKPPAKATKKGHQAVIETLKFKPGTISLRDFKK